MKKSKKNHRITTLDRDSRGLVTLTSNPIWRAFFKKPVPEGIRISVGLAARKALYAMSHGFGELDHLGELVLAAHTGAVLAEQGCGNDLLADIQVALGHLADCRMRAFADSSYILLEQEIPAITNMIALYEQQVALVTQDDLANAIVEGYRRSSIPTQGTTPLA